MVDDINQLITKADGVALLHKHDTVKCVGDNKYRAIGGWKV